MEISQIKELFLELAIQIAYKLEQGSVRGNKGLTWVDLQGISFKTGFQPRPLTYELYDGIFEPAILFAAIFRVTNDEKFKFLCQDSLANFFDYIEQGSYESLIKIGIGGTSGVSSIIYSLVKVSEFLNDPSILEYAVKISKFITNNEIEKDTLLDVTSGAAGAILGLLSLYKLTNDLNLLYKAYSCGELLLKNRAYTMSGYKTWKTLGGFLTGFAHGASGIAYSLISLYQYIPNYNFLSAALEAFRYEASVFDNHTMNWPDYRDGQKSFMLGWCHGSPGILLSRIGCIKIIHDDQI
jgi:lantibiotic modifying enzyme